MFNALTFFIAAALLTLAPAVGRSEKIPHELFERVAAEGKVLVLVGLSVPWSLEAKLSESSVRKQREAVDRVQQRLLDELSGTRFKVVLRHQVIPGISLEVESDALAVLANSSVVTNVVPDRPGKIVQAGETAAAQSPDPPEQGTAYVGMVPAELFLEASRAGTVLVLVELKAPWSPEESLKKELLLAQRQAITAAQNYLLAELADTHYRITRRHENVPGIALEVDVGALRVLAGSAAVTSVWRDGPPH